MSKKPLAVCIADTHLSEKTIAVNFQVFEQAFDLCDKLGVSEIYHLGDIFTSRKGQPEIVANAFATILELAKGRDIRIIAIAGNHDKQSLISPSSFLDAFQGNSHFHCISPYGVLKYEGINVHFLPYYDEKLIYKEYLSKIKCPLDAKNVLITHVGVSGILNNSGTEIENEISSNLFANFDLVLVGHYHNRSIIDNVVYTGSTFQANFGEDVHKGATILYNDASYEFVQFEFPQYNTIEIDSTELNRDLIKQVKEKDTSLNVRFKIKGELEESKKALLAELQQIEGVKTEVIKEDFQPLDVLQSENLQMTSNDIISMFDEWGLNKAIEDQDFGKKLLMKNI